MKRTLQIALILFLFISFSACQNDKKEEKIQTTTIEKIDREVLQQTYANIQKEYEKLRPKVIQPAEGYLKYPYLIPAGFYKQMWDWDGFFMGNHFISQNQPEYMKYWALNLIEGVDEEGYVSGCATINGPRPIFGKFSMKPFLSQGVYLASDQMNDFEWVKEHYHALMKVLEYRDKTQLDTIYGLYYWDNAMQSGADNNPAMNYFWKEDHRSFLSCDASTFSLREIIAQAKIADHLGYAEDAQKLLEKAIQLEEAIKEHLWCDEDKMFYNIDRETGDFYRRVSYSCFVPLLQKILSQENGKAMIEKYLASKDHMKAAFGYRTLSKQDPDYNNKNIIVPFSNWQGPVWPIANYIYSIGLKHYGFEEELAWQAQTLGHLMLTDLEKWGSLHENYHADTGAPLAPSSDHVDENGKFVGFISWNLCVENMLAGVVEDEWMLLELKFDK